MIRWKCPHCQSTLGTPEWAMGRRVPCPVCTNGIKVPAASDDDPVVDESGREQPKKMSCCGCIALMAVVIFLIGVLITIL